MGAVFVFALSAAILFLGMHRGHCARIVGGHVSSPHSRPYMAAIMRGNNLLCGGTLIQENWVLTAAHCPIYIGDKVVLGAHSLTAYEMEKQLFQVAEIVRHRNFIQKTLEHDIMLLKLNGRARLHNSVKTALLPTPNEDVRQGTQCHAAGWGVTQGKTKSDVLKEITVTIWNRRDCKPYYGALLTTNKLCAAPTNQNGGHCNGDSGGPLMCGGIQRGIISFHPHDHCAKPNIPDGYTNLSNYIVWIKNNIQK